MSVPAPVPAAAAVASVATEYHTFSLTNPLCHEPPLKTHPNVLGISCPRTGKWSITAVNSIAGTAGWHINGAIHQPLLLLLLLSDTCSPLPFQFVHHLCWGGILFQLLLHQPAHGANIPSPKLVLRLLNHGIRNVGPAGRGSEHVNIVGLDPHNIHEIWLGEWHRRGSHLTHELPAIQSALQPVSNLPSYLPFNLPSNLPSNRSLICPPTTQSAL